MNVVDESARGPNLIDVHVGARIRVRRKSLGVSQQQLASALGLTFQQVQKYERGANRISASKLFDTARYLRAPVSYFFEGLTYEAPEAFLPTDDERYANDFLLTAEGIDLAALFPKMPARFRRRVLELVRTLTDDTSEQE